MIQSCRSPGDVWSPGHVGIEEIRGGAGGGGGVSGGGVLRRRNLAPRVGEGREFSGGRRSRRGGAPKGAWAVMGSASKGRGGALKRRPRSLWGQPRPARPGSALSLQDLLGLLLLFPVAAHVAEGAEVRGLPYRGPSPGMDEAPGRRTDRGESGSPCPASCHCRVAPQLGAPPGAEAGASAGSDELSVKRPGPCSSALGSRPPTPHPRSHYPAIRCIKDLNRSHCPSLLILSPLSPFGLGAPTPCWLCP